MIDIITTVKHPLDRGVRVRSLSVGTDPRPAKVG